MSCLIKAGHLVNCVKCRVKSTDGTFSKLEVNAVCFSLPTNCLRSERQDIFTALIRIFAAFQVTVTPVLPQRTCP